MSKRVHVVLPSFDGRWCVISFFPGYYLRKILLTFLMISLLPFPAFASGRLESKSGFHSSGLASPVGPGSPGRLKFEPLSPTGMQPAAKTSGVKSSPPELPVFPLQATVTPRNSSNSSSSEGNEIVWEPSSLSRVVHPGETVMVTVMFTSSEDLSDVHFTISDEKLKDATLIMPETIAAVKAGMRNSVCLMFQIPKSMEGSSSILQGVFHLNASQGGSGSATIPALLPIQLNVRPGVVMVTPPTFIDGQVFDSSSGLPLRGRRSASPEWPDKPQPMSMENFRFRLPDPERSALTSRKQATLPRSG